MTKRLISLMLAVLMLAFVFVSCGNDGDAINNAVNEASRYTSTINMWVITESALVERASELLMKGNDPDKYPEETYKQNDEQKAFLATLAAENANLEKAWRQLDDVCDRINDLTKKRFKTQVNIKYFTEESYYTKLEAAFSDMAALKAETEKTGKPIFPEVAEDETVTNDQGVPELKYPHAWDAQVDIVYVSGAQNYFKYVNNGWLSEIKEDDIPNSAPQLVYHLTSALLAAPKYNGMNYAIPNNNPLGEYTFLAVDTELANKYYIDVNAMENSLYSSETQRFLQYVYNEGTEGLYPIYSESGKVDFEMLHYWSFDENCVQDPATFSLFGGFYNESTTPADTVVYRNLFTQLNYTEALKAKTYYENTADYITQDADAKAAVRVVKGTVADKAALESQGYTVLTTAAPRISDDDVYGSMFAIGAVTRDKNRNLEIIAMLNTEAEVRNLLQYGIEGTNYTLKTVKNAEGTVIGTYADMTAENMYVMDLAKTGNMFVAYPNAETSDFANGKYGLDAWANAKKQNLEAKLYPTLGLNFNAEYQVDVKAVRILNAVSAKFKSVVLDNLTTVAQVEELAAGAASASSGGNAATSAWILGLTGEVTYTPVGATDAVAVTVDDLTLVLTGLGQSYNDTIAAGSVLSTKVLYDEWWFRNYGTAK